MALRLAAARSCGWRAQRRRRLSAACAAPPPAAVELFWRDTTAAGGAVAEGTEERAASAELQRVALAWCGGGGGVDIEVGPRGKPRLAGGGVAHNAAHTKGFFVCAAAPGAAELGVDVEEVGRAPKRGVERLARRWFSDAEAAELEALPEGEARRARFVELWTLKEAYVKALGLGIAGQPFRTFSVKLAGGGAPALVPPAGADATPESLRATWGLALLRPTARHVVALCWEGGGPLPALRWHRAEPPEVYNDCPPG